MIEEAAGAGYVVAAKDLRPCRHGGAEVAQEPSTGLQSRQRVAGVNLQSSRKVVSRERREPTGVGSQGQLGIGGKRAAGNKGEARQREPLGATDVGSRHWVAIGPRPTGAG